MENNSKYNKGFIVPLIVTIVVILIIGGIAYFSYEKGKSAQIVQDNNQMIATTTVSTNAANNISRNSVVASALVTTWPTYTESQSGFSFQYPPTWSTPTKTVSNADIEIDFGNENLVIWDNQISTLGQNMTAANFIAKEEALPNAQVQQIQVSGKIGVRVSYANDPGSEDIVVPDSQGNIIDIEDYTNNSGQNLDYATISKIIASFQIFTPTSTSQNNQIPSWKTYTDPQIGISFQYPTSLNSTYAGLGSVSAFSSNTNSIDDKGCYELQGLGKGGPWSDAQDTLITLNNMAFCVSSGGDVGAGHLTTEYDYTTKENGTYITLTYSVGGPNGCGAYEGGPGYQACEDFFTNDYNSAVVNPIQQSAGTLTFTN